MEKSDALHSLLHICDKLVFVGSMAFTFLSALGLPVSPSLVEKHALGQAMQLLDIAKDKRVEVLLPKDFWCSNEAQSCQEVQVSKVHCVMDGKFYYVKCSFGINLRNVSILALSFWCMLSSLRVDLEKCLGCKSLIR